MSKITIKLQTNTKPEEAEFLVSLAKNFAPERDIEIIWCDDPSLNVVVHEYTPSTNGVAPVGGREFNPHAKPDGGEYGRD